MKNFLALSTFLLSFPLFSQLVVDSALYSMGDEDTEFSQVLDTSANSTCPISLTVNVPAGRFVSSVEVEYDIEALGGGWQIEQWSYLECVTTGNKESSFTSGPSVTSNGVVSYNRSGLTIANGLVSAGGLQFRLHAFRTFGSSPPCDQGDQKVNNNTFKIKVTHGPPPVCFAPSSLSVSGISATGTTLDWTSGGATDWQIEYGPSGFTPGSGTLVNVSSKPYLLSGLNASTTYDFRVRDSCGINDVSFWTAFSSFQTTCAAVSAPWTEDFESSDWVLPSISFFDNGSIDTCFTRNHANHFTITPGPPPFPSFGTGPSGDHTTGSGQYLFSDRVEFGTFPDTAFIITPAIDLTPLTAPQLTFWTHLFGNQIGTLNVDVSTNGGQTFTNLFSKTGQQQTSKTDAWDEQIVSLTSYANQTVRLRFQVIVPLFGGSETAIDDISIHEAPSCPKPQNLAVDYVWLDEATLSWTSGGVASDWEIEYGAPNFSIGSGTRISANSNPATLTGLLPNTSYQAYVRDSCGPGDVSVWVGPISFKTLCNPAVAPLSRDFANPNFGPGLNFNDTGFIANCWRRSPVGDYNWKGGPPNFPPFNTGPSVDHTSGTANGEYLFADFVGFFNSPVTTADVHTMLVDASPLTVPELTFWYHMFGAQVSGLELYVTKGNGLWNLEWSISGQQQSVKADAWKEAVVNLSAYANDTIQLRFRAIKTPNGNASDIAIDDIDIHEQPSCPKPQFLTLVGMTNSTATLQWQSGGAANWQIEYGAPGFVQGNGTIVSASSNPFTVTGLSPNTGYDFYVRDSCAANDVSDWTGPVGDTTDCNPAAAPFTENFDGSNWVVSPFGPPGAIDPCWERERGNEYRFSAETSSPLFTSGPHQDHTSGNGKFLMARRVFGIGFAPTLRAEVVSPLIDLSPLNIPELTFWYHLFGSDIDSLSVEVFDGATWTTAWSIAGPQQTAKTDPWQEAVVNISSYANDTIKVRFRAYRLNPFSLNAGISIDDFDVHEQPTCPQPSSLAVTGAGASSVTLAWTSGGASDWQIEYGSPGFTLGTGTVVNANANPFSVTGLNPSTTYQFYVRDSCSATDVSFWTGPVTASTVCLPVPAPFTENFDGPQWVIGQNFVDTGSVAQCWNRTPLQSYFWKPGPPAFAPFQTGPSGDHTSGSGKYIYTETLFGGTTPFDAFLETPFIDLSSLNTPEFSFWYHLFGQDIGSLSVEIDNGSGYVNLTTLTGQQQTSSADAWKEAIVNLSAYANDTVRIRFKATKTVFGNRADVAVDDISFQEAPSCPKPQNLTIAGKTSSTVTLQWQSGGVADWQIEYGAPGFSLGSGTLINVTSNPFTVTGLSPNTGYEFYVRDSCGVADVSDWSNAAGDTTDCTPVSAPWMETFDGAVWTPSPTVAPGTIDACWQRLEGVSYQFTPELASPLFASGPTKDHTSGSGKFLMGRRFFGMSQNSLEAEIESPLVDLAALTTPELTFWYHLFGADIDSLVLDVSDGNGWTQEFALSGQQQNAKSDAWKVAVVNLSAYANDTIKLRFRAVRNTPFGFDVAVSIDDVDIHEQPTCPRPSNLQVGVITATSVALSWTSGGAANAQIGYRVSGSGAPLTLVSATGNSATVSGLIPSTTYDFFVRDSCGVGDVSFYSSVLHASTLCGVVTAPWQENFDGGNWVSGTGFNNAGHQVSACWTRPTADEWNFGTRQGITNSVNTGPDTDASGSGNYLYTEASGAGGNQTGEITTPQIYIPANLQNPRLKFAYHLFGNQITSLEVEISTGGGFSNIYTKNGQQQTSNAAAWLYDSVALGSYAGDTVQFKFLGANTGFTGDIAIDEVEVKSDGSAPCAPPINLSVSSITPLTASVVWNSGSNFSNVQIAPLGQPQGSGSNFLNVGSPLPVSGLSANTTYVVYVQDSCAAGGLSVWVTDTFTTLVCPPVSAAFVFNRNAFQVAFNGGGSSGQDTLIWDFGDGSGSSLPNPAHTYATPGFYTVHLFAVNACGSADTATQIIQICDSLSADFSVTVNGDTVFFDGSASQNALNFYWDFGNGDSDTGQTTQYAFSTTATQTVTLIVTNECGDSASIAKPVKTCGPPVADWTYNIISTTGSGMLVQFDGTASQNATTFEWDFGDGSPLVTGNVQPQHNFLTPGLFYKVKLCVENACAEKNCKAFKLSEIGLDEISLAESLQLFPNPATAEATLEWDVRDFKIQNVEISDVSGKTVFRKAISKTADGILKLDLRPLATGSYLVKIVSDKAVAVKKLEVR